MKTKFNGILTLFLALIVQISFAQDKIISGVVSDESGPLPGVTIIKKGTTIGVETDFDGNYTINAKSGDVLVFNFVGMKTTQRTVKSSNQINVVMENDNVLEEVVILGYNSKSKDILTSGVSTVTAQEISAVSSTTNITNALQGKAAGVVVTAANGKPGEGAFVRIRGIGSANAGQEPLYIVDGIPVSESDLNLINSSDVESISVLKDASSTAAYGARGSNGVVVMTTKQGKQGAKAKIKFSSQIGFSEKVKDNFTMMNAEQKLQYEREIGKGTGSNLSENEWNRLVSYNHDWQNDLLKTGFIKSNGISISGGSEKSSYFVSFKSESDTGIIDGLNGFERTTGRINLSSELNDWLDFRITSGVSHTFSTEPRDTNNVQNPFATMYTYNSYEPLYNLDSNGNIILDSNGQPTYNLTHSGFSISEAIRNNPSSEEYLRFIGSAALDFKFLENKLIYTPQISLTYNTLRSESYIQPGSVLDGYIGDKKAPGIKTDRGNSSFTYNFLNKISYNDSFDEVHNYGITLFTEFYNNNFRRYRLSSKGFPSPDLNTQDNSAEPTNASSFRSEETLFSTAALLDYNYNEKYVLSASLRRDGSSRFGDNKKYGVFWSASAAWNIHKEVFLKANFINDLKLRVSYGTSGNDRVPGRYSSLDTYSLTSYNGESAAYPNNVPNKDLQWESKASFDLGLDFTLFNRRVNGVINYFNTKTKDLIFQENLAQSTGAAGNPSRFVNLGKISSTGLEAELNGDLIKNENFTWNLGANIAFVRTIVDELPGGLDKHPSSYPNIILREGERMNTHFLVRYAGVNPKNGRALYYDKNGVITEKYNPNDAVVLKDKTPSPDFDGSLNTKLSYKGISLSANMYFKYGNYIYNNQESQHLTDGNSIVDNQRLDAFNFWRKPGDVNVLPNPKDPLNTSERSDRFLQDGSYLRLRSIKLGYDLPKKWLGKNSFFSGVNMYLQGQNIWTYAPHFKGDPEVGFASEESVGRNSVGFIPGAANLNSYPTVKSFLLGIDVTF
ncbi:SusC/RagA family TonB-linked outer membrane protein [Tenacibaculum maritimum]|uniref:SusC/RagA family TonB-linked outer membrane protein n=1 Tax=Tenacibaculum maritimum TaxID=107401 RepID=UPI00388F42F0